MRIKHNRKERKRRFTSAVGIGLILAMVLSITLSLFGTSDVLVAEAKTNTNNISVSGTLSSSDSNGYRTLSVSWSAGGVPAASQLNSVSYQWYKNGSAISGATSSTYSFKIADHGGDSYYCVVKGNKESFYSLINDVYEHVFQRKVDEVGITNRWSEIIANGYLETANKHLYIDGIEYSADYDLNSAKSHASYIVENVFGDRMSGGKLREAPTAF